MWVVRKDSGIFTLSHPKLDAQLRLMDYDVSGYGQPCIIYSAEIMFFLPGTGFRVRMGLE